MASKSGFGFGSILVWILVMNFVFGIFDDDEDETQVDTTEKTTLQEDFNQIVEDVTPEIKDAIATAKDEFIKAKELVEKEYRDFEEGRSNEEKVVKNEDESPEVTFAKPSEPDDIYGSNEDRY